MKKDIKLLITGGSGFIGTNICQSLINKDYNFVNIDINPPKIDKHLKYWKQIDIRDINSLFEITESYQPTHILNLAADLGMDHKSLENLQTNIVGVENIIKVIKSVHSIKKVVL